MSKWLGRVVDKDPEPDTKLEILISIRIQQFRIRPDPDPLYPQLFHPHLCSLAEFMDPLRES